VEASTGMGKLDLGIRTTRTAGTAWCRGRRWAGSRSRRSRHADRTTPLGRPRAAAWARTSAQRRSPSDTRGEHRPHRPRCTRGEHCGGCLRHLAATRGKTASLLAGRRCFVARGIRQRIAQCSRRRLRTR
jgi:hypothetical protein